MRFVHFIINVIILYIILHVILQIHKRASTDYNFMAGFGGVFTD